MLDITMSTMILVVCRFLVFSVFTNVSFMYEYCANCGGLVVVVAVVACNRVNVLFVLWVVSDLYIQECLGITFLK